MLSIIITHHKTPVLLKLCLKAIKETVGSLEYEIIIADSETDPSTQELIKEIFPEANFIASPKNIGYAKIVNSGIRQSQGNYILIINADIIVLKNAIQKMVEFIQNNPRVGLIGPQLLTFSHQLQHSSFAFPTPGSILARRTFIKNLNWGRKKLNQFLINHDHDSSPKITDWIQGSAMLTSREAIEKIGLFDERFFMYFEDVDWCRRFWQNGYQVVYLPTAQMSHYYYRASKKWGGLLDPLFNKYTRAHLASAVKYFWKWKLATKYEKHTNTPIMLRNTKIYEYTKNNLIRNS